jgi:hypothetical protein
MTVSTSTVVFAIATCLPFGIAIVDTVRDKPPGLDDDARLDAEAEARLARERADEAAREAEAEAMHQHRQLMLIDLIGREPATLGSSLEGIAIGMSAADFGRHRDVLDRLHDATGAAVRGDVADTSLHALVITPARDTCDFVATRLDKLWGAGHSTGDHTFWHSGDSLVRASYAHDLGDGCSLRFEQYVPVDAWFGKKPGAIVPAAFIGKPADALIADIMSRTTADRVEQTDEQVHWLDAGVGDGTGRTAFQAIVARGKVAWIEARTEVTASTLDALRERITALHGQPTDGDKGLLWNSKPPIAIALWNSITVALTVGTLP